MSLSRAWDAFDAYLFDIDGTLLHCRDAVHYFGFCEVLTKLAGKPVNLDGVVAHGNVDPGIIRDAMARAGVADTVWRPHLSQLCGELASYVEQHRDEFRIEVLPGVPRVLQHLRQQGRVLGVATGNLERIGWTKLDVCGLRQEFSFGGFSDSYEYRGPMITGAVEKARSLAGAGARVCVVGDTPSDIRAAREAGVEVIAVATGIYPQAELHEADLVVPSMPDLMQGTVTASRVIRS